MSAHLRTYVTVLTAGSIEDLVALILELYDQGFTDIYVRNTKENKEHEVTVEQLVNWLDQQH